VAAPLTIVQVSDTHLSRTHAWFTANWPVFVEEMRTLSPDFIVNSGDISFNGPDRPDDLAFAADCHRTLCAPWRAIAGNHDVGEAPVASRLNQPVNDARLDAWQSHVGPSWWVEDLGTAAFRLRLIGLDSALMGSGLPQEAQQAAFLETALGTCDGRTTLVFTHMPPFGEDPDDRAISTHCLLPEPRRWLLDRCLSHRVAVLCAGHIHRYSMRDYKGLPIVTAPATSFFNKSSNPHGDIDHGRAGYLVWRLDADGLHHEVVRPPLFLTIDASNWNEHAKTTTSLPERALSAPFW
jgi:3',5'-cyclic AMP phosphodiesterase CpdA